MNARVPFAAPKPPAIGSLVITPTGRVAKIVDYDSDGRACLRYQDCAPHLATVDLFPRLLRPYLPAIHGALH